MALAGRTLTWLDVATGALAATMELPFAGNSLVVWEDTAVVGELDGDSFCGVHLLRREVVWTRPLRLELSARFGIDDVGRSFRPTSGSGQPFVGYLWESKRLIALDLQTGEPRWSQPAPAGRLARPWSATAWYTRRRTEWGWSRVVATASSPASSAVDMRSVRPSLSAAKSPWEPVTVTC